MHWLWSSIKEMKYLVLCIPVTWHSQRSMCIKSPSLSALLSLWHRNGVHASLACMHAAQSNFGKSMSFTIIPVTSRLLSVHCSPLTPIWLNRRCQSSQVFAISIERATLSRAGAAVTSSKYICSTFHPTAIKFLFLSYRWMRPSPIFACLPLSSNQEMENRLFGACGT